MHKVFSVKPKIIIDTMNKKCMTLIVSALVSLATPNISHAQGNRAASVGNMDLDLKKAIEIVLPDQTQGLGLVSGKDYVTLVTCTPYGVNTHRILVRGHRVPYVPGEEDGIKAHTWLNMNIMMGLVGALLGILIALLLVIRMKKRDKRSKAKVD